MNEEERRHEFANYGDDSQCLCVGGSKSNREAVWRRWWAKQKALKGK